MLSDEYIDEKYTQKNNFLLLIKSIITHFKKIGFHFIMLFDSNFFNPNIKNKIVFFSTSKNNDVALSPVYETIDESILLSKDYRSRRKNFLLPLFPPLIVSLLYLPVIMIMHIFCNKKEKKRILLFFHEVLLSMGYDFCVRYYLKYLQPKGIVFANDHLYYTRSLVKQARRYNITSFYIQHSAVTEVFPPIISSFALLDGIESHKKYFSMVDYPINNNSFLIGAPKFDKYFRYINKNKVVKSIGVCSTQSMIKEEVENLIQKLQSQFPNKIIFRPHPSEIINSKYHRLETGDSFQFSNSLTDSSFEFLKTVDVVISGNSSILLEAVMLNVYPIFWDNPNQEVKYKDNPNDKYGFVQNKVVSKCNTIEEINQKIEKLLIKKPFIRNRAKPYIHTIGTINDGASTNLAANIILSKINTF